MKIPNCQRVGYLERTANQRWRHAQQHNVPPVQKFNAAMQFLVFSWSSSNCSNIKFEVVRSRMLRHVEFGTGRRIARHCCGSKFVSYLRTRWCSVDLRCTWWNPLWEMHDLQWDCWASPPAESMDMDSWVMVGSCWVKQQKVDATIYNQGLCKRISPQNIALYGTVPSIFNYGGWYFWWSRAPAMMLWIGLSTTRPWECKRRPFETTGDI